MLAEGIARLAIGSPQGSGAVVCFFRGGADELPELRPSAIIQEAQPSSGLSVVEFIVDAWAPIGPMLIQLGRVVMRAALRSVGHSYHLIIAVGLPHEYL